MAELVFWSKVYYAVCAICFGIWVLYHIIHALTHQKVLKALGYDKPWMAWIPYVNNYAYADCVAGKKEKIVMWNLFSVPAVIYKLWWLVRLMSHILYVFGIVSLSERTLAFIAMGIKVVFLGSVYAKMFAMLDGKEERKEQVLGCISGTWSIVAVVKFLTIKRK